MGNIGTFTVTTSGYPNPTLSETGTLPNGVTFVDNGDGTAMLSGAPAAGTDGIYDFTITATNGVGQDATQNFTLTIDAAPQVIVPAPVVPQPNDPNAFLVLTAAPNLHYIAAGSLAIGIGIGLAAYVQNVAATGA